MKMNDGKRQNINWNDQNLGCDIGENLLKHMAWQPG